MKKRLLRQLGLGILVIATWYIVGCEKGPGGSSTPAQAGAQGNQQALPGATAPPPPIAPPVGPGPHPGMGGDMAQHPAGRVMEQINQYKQRLEANPKDVEALIALGNANFDIQRFDKATELYLRALEIEPKNVLVRTDLASCYRNMGDVEQAFKELNQVLSIDPKHENALYNLGVLLLNDKQDPKGAAAAWERLIAAHPDVAYASDLKKKIEELNAPQAGQGGPGKR